MATVTPNYSWPVPTSTDYVADGAVAIEALGDSVDATLFTALGGAYPGLRLVKKQTIGTGVSSVNVTGAFSATYQAYKIIIAGGVGSTNQAISLKMGSAANGHDSALIYTPYAGGSILNDCYSNAATWPLAGYSTTSGLTMNVDVVNPFLTSLTRFYTGFSDQSNTGTYNGRQSGTTSFTDFTIAVGGTMTGGTIYVYGYGAS
jgi:hypothetical protein